MSDTMLNLDFSEPSHSGKKKDCHNARHQRFVKKRHYLERRGLLNKKQNKNNAENKKNRKRRIPDHSQTGAVFPQFTTSKPELSKYPSSSLETHHASVPPKSTSSKEYFSSRHLVPSSLDKPLKYVAIDCEMVGTGPKGHCSELARCSVVSYDGDVIYDKFIKPVNKVTDLRTRWSGVRWQDLCNATPFEQAQKEILKILSGKVVVGHAVQNDFKVLHYSHPTGLTRDTSRMPILNIKAGLPEKQPASLKTLTKILFNKNIQVGKKGHCSVEDAKAAMELYKIVEMEWERMMC